MNNSTKDKDIIKKAPRYSSVKKDPNVTFSVEEYHRAWQEYYRKYYEKYYSKAIEDQKNKLLDEAKKEILDKIKNSNDGIEKNAIEALKADFRKHLKNRAKRIKKSKFWFPSVFALVVILLFLFIQYNSLLIANVIAIIAPSNYSNNQTIIVGPNDDKPIGPESRVIIPKLNVNAPVEYGLTDFSDNSVQRELRNGVIHLPVDGASSVPGEKGNTVILGHSSADFFQEGKYKFIFIQLNKLENGDIFYLDYKGTRYAYKVIKKAVINPDQINLLNMGRDLPYATLVTCDPPGTILKRLAVYGEQIYPNNSDNNKDIKDGEGNNEEPSVKASKISGNPPTLFERLFGR